MQVLDPRCSKLVHIKERIKPYIFLSLLCVREGKRIDRRDRKTRINIQRTSITIKYARNTMLSK